MKYDEKALEAAWQAYFEPYDSKEAITSMQAAIAAYCEKAGVVMVPKEPTVKMILAGAKPWGVYDLSENEETAKNIRDEYHQMIRASQEEE